MVVDDSFWPLRARLRHKYQSARDARRRKRPQSTRSLVNAQLLMRPRENFALSDQPYGSPRIWKGLVVAGERCGENRVARLMRLAGIRAQPKPRRRGTMSLDVDGRRGRMTGPRITPC